MKKFCVISGNAGMSANTDPATKDRMGRNWSETEEEAVAHAKDIIRGWKNGGTLYVVEIKKVVTTAARVDVLNPEEFT